MQHINTLLDPVVNFGKVTVSGGYTNTATEVTLITGDGSKLPNPVPSGSFNLVWFNNSTYSDPADDPYVEIVRCIARVGDVLTLMRAQEGTVASNKNISAKIYKMILSPTKKTITDIQAEYQSGVSAHSLVTSSVHNFDSSGNAPAQTHGISRHTGTIGTWSDIDKTISSIADITTRSHTLLTDIGTNTHAIIDTAILNSTTHIGASIAHNVTSNIVGISDIQTLTNKTLTSPFISTIYGGSATNDDIIIEGTSNATKTSSYVILQPTSGNVGIGAMNPMSRLHIVSSLNEHASSLATSMSKSTTFIQTKSGSGAGIAYTQITPNVQAIQGVYSDGSESLPLVLNPYGGNIGIGTTNPVTKLDVSSVSPNTVIAKFGQNQIYHASDIRPGGVATYRDILQLYAEGTANYAYDMKWYLKGTSGSIWKSSTYLTLDVADSSDGYVSRQSIVTFKGDGNVGIGTTDPGATLEVNGSLKVVGTAAQIVTATSTTTSALNISSFTEASSTYRISITPKFSGSKIIVEFNFSVNQALTANTVHHMQLVRNIGGSEVPIGVGPTNGSRNLTSWVSRPNNGFDTNDQGNVYMMAIDTGLTAGQVYTYGFKYRRESGGSGTIYFNYSLGDVSSFGFSGVMTMKITEITQ